MAIRTSNDLRAVLAEQIVRVRNGKSTPQQSNAIANATAKILASIRLEMEYAKAVGMAPQIDFLGKQKALPEPKKPTKRKAR